MNSRNQSSLNQYQSVTPDGNRCT